MRCDDCLDDLPSVHFLVLEPELIDYDEDGKPMYELDERRLCHDCAGWYRDAVEVTE